MDTYHNSLEKGDFSSKIPINEIGVTAAPMKDQLQELQAKIRFGVSKVELGFWGSSKGSEGQPVPGMYGKDQREAIKGLAQINNVELTTHASPNIAPISGFNKEGFDNTVREQSLNEIRRAIDFAADTAEGGAVVFHTGEFPREAAFAGINGERGQFQGYTYTDSEGNKRTESDEAVIYLADEKTGKLINAVKKDMPLFFPELERNADGTFKINKEDQSFVTSKDSIGSYGEEDVKKKPYSWEDIKKGLNVETDEDVAKFIFKQQIEDQKKQLKGNMAYYGGIIRNTLERYGGEDNLDEQNKKEIQHYRDSISNSKKQLAELNYRVENTKSIKEVGEARTSESMADLGIYAWKKQKSQKLKKDLYVAPENIFPEQYGAHPDELLSLVEKSRERMKQKLVSEEKMNEQEAKKIADSHIKATFDIGHANIWRKYFQMDPNSKKTKDEQFDEWLLKKVDKLKNAGVLGHVHVSDNFGYSDEHTDPGQGNVPLQGFLDKIKGSDIDVVVETASQGDRAFLAGFKEMGHPIYGLSRPSSVDSWDVIENSFFGRTAPPYFVVGEYAQQIATTEMTKNSFSTWSGTPFE